MYDNYGGGRKTWLEDTASVHDEAYYEEALVDKGQYLSLDLHSRQLDARGLDSFLTPGFSELLRAKLKAKDPDAESYYIDVDASENQMGPQAMKVLSSFLLSLHTGGPPVSVKSLRLYKNGLGDEGAAVVAEIVLEQPAPLIELHLSHNGIKELGAAIIIMAFAKARKTSYPFPLLSKPTKYGGCWLRLEHNEISRPQDLVNQLKRAGATGGDIRLVETSGTDEWGADKSPSRATSPRQAPHVILNLFHKQTPGVWSANDWSPSVDVPRHAFAVIEKVSKRLEDRDIWTRLIMKAEAEDRSLLPVLRESNDFTARWRKQLEMAKHPEQEMARMLRLLQKLREQQFPVEQFWPHYREDLPPGIRRPDDLFRGAGAYPFVAPRDIPKEALDLMQLRHFQQQRQQQQQQLLAQTHPEHMRQVLEMMGKMGKGALRAGLPAAGGCGGCSGCGSLAGGPGCGGCGGCGGFAFDSSALGLGKAGGTFAAMASPHVRGGLPDGPRPDTWLTPAQHGPADEGADDGIASQHSRSTDMLADQRNDPPPPPPPPRTSSDVPDIFVVQRKARNKISRHSEPVDAAVSEASLPVESSRFRDEDQSQPPSVAAAASLAPAPAPAAAAAVATNRKSSIPAVPVVPAAPALPHVPAPPSPQDKEKEREKEKEKENTIAAAVAPAPATATTTIPAAPAPPPRVDPPRPPDPPCGFTYQ